MSVLCPAYTARLPRSLRRSGFRGATVTVVLADDAVTLAGAGGGARAIAIADIAGLRAGLVEAKFGPHPELRLRLAGGETLRLDPMPDRGDAAARRAYPDFVRGLAARLAGAGRLSGVETGVGRAGAAVFAALLALAATAMAGLAAWTWLDPPADEAERWIARGVTSLLALLLLALVAWFWRAQWPRPVTDLEDLEAVLPRR